MKKELSSIKSVGILLFQVAWFCVSSINGGCADNEESVIISEPLRNLTTPDISRVPSSDQNQAPLIELAEDIRKKIDPTAQPGWPDSTKYKMEFIEFIEEIHSDYDRFWEHIRPEACRLMDIDNDGIDEYIVVSNGLNNTAWGFKNFIAVIKQLSTPDENGRNWRFLFFETFDESECPAYSSKDGERLQFRNFEIVTGDFDRDGRPDLLFTTMQIGGSDHCYYLHIISQPADMKIRHHKLWSRSPVTILSPDALHPVFVASTGDEWGYPDDCGAAVRARGDRHIYYHWNCNDGFVRF